MADEHDLIVIGMGVGGEEVASRAAESGMDVLSIERKLVGGECPYWGCIPSKIMVRAGNSLAEAFRVTGLAGGVNISPEWAPVAKRVREATADWNDETAVERHEKKGETFVRGSARFAGPHEVEVDGRTFKARRGIVVATGGEPAVPPIDGLKDIDFWTNRDAIEATDAPRSMVVLGAGPIGLELAQVYRRFGTEITIVELAEHALPMEEPENGDALGEVLRDEGMTLYTGVAASSVKQSGDEIAVELEDGRVVEGATLLVATGRRLNLAELSLDQAGLDPGAKWIETDEHMRAGDGIWAVGDVTGKANFTHLAVYQGRVAAADILGHDHRPADYSAIPRVTFTDPEVASVGLSEAQAREKGLAVKTGIAKTSSSARGWIHGPGAEHGVSKLVADTDAGVLVGASTMGPAAGEVLGLLVLAVKERIPIASLRDLIYPYPTFVRGLEDALREIGG
jgi:pyruvate/2-oxoglutarate dehydrogenase complex dihydrolipoamide dehydrogenase (E3) component